MQNQAEYLLVFTTCPNHEFAKFLANKLVDEKLAASVGIVPKMIAIYEWQGKKEQVEENLLLIKTTKKQYTKLEASIVAAHPYELPEVIAVPINDGLPAYLAWIGRSMNELQ